jgi:tetratricopeptide (TPR) repeat protein
MDKLNKSEKRSPKLNSKLKIIIIIVSVIIAAVLVFWLVADGIPSLNRTININRAKQMASSGNVIGAVELLYSLNASNATNLADDFLRQKAEELLNQNDFDEALNVFDIQPRLWRGAGSSAFFNYILSKVESGDVHGAISAGKSLFAKEAFSSVDDEKFYTLIAAFIDEDKSDIAIEFLLEVLNGERGFYNYRAAYELAVIYSSLSGMKQAAVYYFRQACGAGDYDDAQTQLRTLLGFDSDSKMCGIEWHVISVTKEGQARLIAKSSMAYIPLHESESLPIERDGFTLYEYLKSDNFLRNDSPPGISINKVRLPTEQEAEELVRFGTSAERFWIDPNVFVVTTESTVNGATSKSEERLWNPRTFNPHNGGVVINTNPQTESESLIASNQEHEVVPVIEITILSD